MKKIIKKNNLYYNPIFFSSYRILTSFLCYFKFKPFSFAKDFFLYVGDYFKLTMAKNKEFNVGFFYPCLSDRTIQTPLDINYFYQDTWAARKIFEAKPRYHLDIGSHAKTVGIISQFVKTTMVDIRPLPVNLSGLDFVKGDILNLPFKDNSIESLSSLCVIEHIGLGRYGDSIDSTGSEKAIKEIKRVMKKDGVVLFSVPVFRSNTVFFNAHRAFTRDYILELFDGFQLVEEKYIYKNKLEDSYKEFFGTGLFMFRKI